MQGAGQLAGRNEPPESAEETGKVGPDEAAAGNTEGAERLPGSREDGDEPATEAESPTPEPETPEPETEADGPEAAAEAAGREGAAEATPEVAAADTSARDREDTRPVAATPPPPRRRGGFFALLLGGALAAAIGFAAARYVLPEGWPVRLERAEPAEAAEARDALEARVSALDARLGEMQQALAQTGAEGPDMAQIEAVIGDRLDEAMAPISGSLDSLEQRVAALESRPVASAPEGAAISAEDVERLDAMRATLEQRRSELEALQARLEETAQKAEARVEDAAARLDDLAATSDGLRRSMALTRLRADIAAGLPFEAALQGLRGAGAEVPEPLARHADAGVASLDALRRSFAAAAREGLAAALQAQGGEDWGARAAGYLRAQVGARSLAPREGDDPDAVLSRAEAALAEADLDGALAELEALGEAGRAAMAGWISDAEAHLAVTAALDSLAAGN